MQEVSGVGFYTSEQHKEETKTRRKRDQKDVMKDQSPFAGDTNLRNIETGVVADRSVNADNAKEVGDNIIKSIKSRTILDFSFKRKDQIVTIASKTSLKIDRNTVHIDPQLLFQRCTTEANGCLMTYQKYLCMNCAIFHHHYLLKMNLLVNHKSLCLQMFCGKIQLMTTIYRKHRKIPITY